ncbi:MAG: sulfatase [Chloroflexi bacterium]|nr:sulfatase [Chloroflexota bacterium]
MNRPNILYIHSHDTGRYVQPYGAPVSTPNIQRLAEGGVVFRQCFSVAPTCSPSRAGLLTGQCAHSAGMIGLAHRGFALNDYRQHIVHTLRQAGYESTLIGVQHVAKRAETIGYDRVVDLPSHDAQDVAPAAVAFLKSKPKQPFFLSVGFAETHREYHEPGPSEDPRYCAPPAPLPDTPETRRDMAAFKASARILDEGMGAVFDALDEAGLAENTLVICTTDHGLAFPAMKCNLTQHGIGVMLILRGPGGFAGGRVCDALVSHIDIFPTICDLLNIERPAWLQGESLLPLIRGEKDEIHDEVFAEVTYHAAYEPQRAVRTKRWSYIRRFGTRTTPVLPNCDDSASKDVWMRYGWPNRLVASEQLYDLIYDPNEACNLVHLPEMACVLHEMRARLDAWMQRTKDPLLAGEPVPGPSGAEVNDPDGISPREPTIRLP